VPAEMGGVYEKVDQMFGAMGGKIVVDSAFARTKIGHRWSRVTKVMWIDRASFSNHRP